MKRKGLSLLCSLTIMLLLGACDFFPSSATTTTISSTTTLSITETSATASSATTTSVTTTTVDQTSSPPTTTTTSPSVTTTTVTTEPPTSTTLTTTESPTTTTTAAPTTTTTTTTAPPTTTTTTTAAPTTTTTTTTAAPTTTTITTTVPTTTTTTVTTTTVPPTTTTQTTTSLITTTTAPPQNYLVIFQDASGNLLEEQTVWEGESAEPPMPPRIVGFVFSHWSDDITFVNSNLTVYPIYVPGYPSKVTLLQEPGNLNPSQILEYTFDLLEPSYVMIYLESSFDSFGTLWNTNGTYIDNDDDSNDGFDFYMDHFLQPGTYRIDVQGGISSASGPFTLHAYAWSSSMREDGVLFHKSGYIEANGYVEIPFLVSEAGEYDLFLISEFDSYGELCTSNWNCLFEDDTENDSDFFFQVYLEPGVHYLYVSGYGSSDYGEFETVIRRHPIVYEQIETITGVLSAAGSSEETIFLSVTGDVLVHMECAFEAFLSIYDPSGTLIGQSASGVDTVFVATPGLWKFVVTGQTATDQGDYAVTLSVNPETIVFEDLLIDQIGAFGQGETIWTDVWFDYGGILTLTLKSEVAAMITLYDSLGNVVAVGESLADPLLTMIHVPLAPSRYRLAIRGASPETQGAFRLWGFLDVPHDVVGFLQGHEGSLSSGAEIRYPVTVLYPVEIMAYLDSEFDSYGRIYNEAGDVIASNDDNNQLDFGVKAKVYPGTYWIGVSGRTPCDYGGFWLEIQLGYYFETNPNELLDMRGYLTPSETQVESFELASFSRIEWYVYSYIDMKIEFRDSSGSIVYEYLYDPNEEDVTISLYLAAGTYQIHFIESTGTNEDSFFTSVYLDPFLEIVDPLVRQGGQIEANQSVTIAFEVAEANYFVLSNWTLLDTTGSLYDGAMNLLAQDDASGMLENFLIGIWLEPGHYTLVLASVDAGVYDVLIDRPGEEVAKYATDAKYAMQALYLDEGETYVLSFELLDPSTVRLFGLGDVDTVCALHHANGAFIIDSDDSMWDSNFDILILLETGTYELRIGGYGGSSSGLVWAVIEQNHVSDVQSEPVVSTSADYTIVPGSSVTFTLVVEDRSEIAMSALSDFDTMVTILDENGNVVATNDNGAQNLSDFFLNIYLEEGTYTVVVSSPDPLDGGTFRFFQDTRVVHKEYAVTVDIETEMDEEDPIFYHRGYVTLFLGESTFVNVYSTGSRDTKIWILDANGDVVAFDNDISETDRNFDLSLILPRGRYYLYVETTNSTDVVLNVVLDTLPKPDATSDAGYAVDEGEIRTIELPVDTLLLVRTSSSRYHYVAIYDLEGAFVALVKGSSNVFHVALLAGTYAMHVLVPYSDYYEDQYAYVNVHIERWELPEGEILAEEDLVLGGNQYRMYDLALTEPSMVVVQTTGVNDTMYLMVYDGYEEVAYNDEEFSLGYGDYLMVFYSTLSAYLQPHDYEIYIHNAGNYTNYETISIVVVPIRNIYH